MSLTGAELLTGFSRFIGDEYDPAGLTTSAAGDSAGTTLIDDSLGEFDDDALVGRWVRVTQSGSNQYLVRRIVANESVSGLVEVRPAFAAQIASGDSYELHRYDPRSKFSAIDEARLRVIDVLAKIVHDDSTTADGVSSVYPIPSTVRVGPLAVREETPLGSNQSWSFLTNPEGDSTSGYTASSTTATIVTQTSADLLVPRLANSCTKLVTAATTAATYSLAVANASNGLTAALAADRKMTYARWVYCTETSKVRVGITDDSTTTYSSYHAGRGWELLTVEKTIAGNNATTLTAVVAIASTANASTIYVERGWWYFGSLERVTDNIFRSTVTKTVRRDDTTQQALLDWVPSRGRQLRFIGLAPVTAIGTVAASQPTNTMEVDEPSALVLYAEAASVLFARLGMNISDYSTVAQNVAAAAVLRRQMVNAWGQNQPVQRVRTMFG